MQKEITEEKINLTLLLMKNLKHYEWLKIKTAIDKAFATQTNKATLQDMKDLQGNLETELM